MSGKKLLTIFGSTGKQGGSVLDAVFADSSLQQKYALRGVTRNASSSSAKTLEQKGVEMVSANVNDLDSLKKAVRGSYGVYSVTNFWDKDVMKKSIEVQQGKNIFEACKAEGVSHLVFSSLPNIEKLSNGVLKHLDHFDGKADVAEYIEANKGDMTASYFMPAMYNDSYTMQVRDMGGNFGLTFPFPLENADKPIWPVIDPKADTGNYVMGLFEGGKSADGVHVNAVSAWMTPNQFLKAASDIKGKPVQYAEMSREAFKSAIPAPIAEELLETYLLIGLYSYYGLDSAKLQEENDKWLVKGAKKTTLEKAVGAVLKA